MVRALRQCENLFSRYYLNESIEDVKFDLQLLDDVAIGAPFRVSVSVTNKSKSVKHSVSVTLRVDSVLYTGKPKSLVKKEKFDRTIACNSGKRLDNKIIASKIVRHVCRVENS